MQHRQGLVRYQWVGRRLATDFLVLSMLSLWGGSALQAEIPVSVSLEASVGARLPVEFPCPEISERTEQLFRLRAPEFETVAQRIHGTARLVFIAPRPIPQANAWKITLTPINEPVDAASPLQCEKLDDAVRISRTGQEVLRYRTRVARPPESIDEIYSRSGFIDPLRTPQGRCVTEAFPADHPHQHGVFCAWVRTKYDGREIDFWNQKAGTGNVEHVSVDRIDNGPVFVGFVATLHHVDLLASEGPQPILEESWTWRVYNVGEDSVLADIELVQQCVADKPLEVQEYHYGGMAIRGNSEWLGQPEHDFLTSEGRSRADGNHTRPDWVRMHGKLDGELCSVTIFNHPGNFRSPQPVRLNPVKPYFVFAPEVLGAFTISAEQPYRARYRYLLQDDLTDPEILNAHWQRFAASPAPSVHAD